MTGKVFILSSILMIFPLLYLQEPEIIEKKIALYQPVEREIFESVPFDSGETIHYKVSWGVINAGSASIKVKQRLMMNGTEVFHVEIKAKTNKFFSVFFKVDDKIESFFDTHSLHSLRFEKRLREGDYKEKRIIDFDHSLGTFQMSFEKEVDKKKQSTRVEKGVIPFWVKDPVSSIFYIRACQLEIGKQFSLTLNAEGKNYNVEVSVEKREEMKTDIGKFETIVVKPTKLGWQGRVFEKNKSTLTIWLTDDKNRIPVLLKSKVKIGSLKFEINEWKKPQPGTGDSSTTDEEEEG